MHISSIESSMKIARSYQIADECILVKNIVLDDNEDINQDSTYAVYNPCLSPLSSSSKSVASDITICTINEEETWRGLEEKQMGPLQHLEAKSSTMQKKKKENY